MDRAALERTGSGSEDRTGSGQEGKDRHQDGGPDRRTTGPRHAGEDHAGPEDHASTGTGMEPGADAGRIAGRIAAAIAAGKPDPPEGARRGREPRRKGFTRAVQDPDSLIYTPPYPPPGPAGPAGASSGTGSAEADQGIQQTRLRGIQYIRARARIKIAREGSRYSLGVPLSLRVRERRIFLGVRGFSPLPKDRAGKSRGSKKRGGWAAVAGNFKFFSRVANLCHFFQVK